jgi:hypothetical protein
VYVERLLRGQHVPHLRPDDVLALFPARFVLTVAYTYNHLLIEVTHDAHADIVGEIDQRFAVFLRDRCTIIDPAKWLEARSNPLRS